MRVLKLIQVVLITLVTLQVSAQEITTVKTFGGLHYYVDDTVEVSSRQVLRIMAINEPAHAEFKNAMALSSVAGALGFCGGLLIGLPVGSALLGGKPEWTLIAIGGSLIGVTISLEMAHKRKARGAIDIYNAALKKAHKVEIKFSGTGAGLAFRL